MCAMCSTHEGVEKCLRLFTDKPERMRPMEDLIFGGGLYEK